MGTLIWLINSQLTGCPKRPPPAVDVVVAPKPPKPPVEAAGAPKAVPAGLAPKSPPPVAAVVGAPKVLVVCPNGALEAAVAPKAPPPPPNNGLFWKGCHQISNISDS